MVFLCNGYSYYYDRHTHVLYALQLTCVSGYCYAYMHTCATATRIINYRGNGRRVP
jgi:hypothetical protein